MLVGMIPLDEYVVVVDMGVSVLVVVVIGEGLVF